VLPELTLLAQRHPLRERLQELLMLALYRDGRQADALAAFRRLRDLLDEQLGLEPGPRLRALEGAILRQDSSLEPPPPEERRRTLVAAGPEPARLSALLLPLAGSLGTELILLSPVAHGDELTGAVTALEPHRSARVRVAAFVSRAPERDVLHLAADEAAELVVVTVPRDRLSHPLPPELAAPAADVALFVDGAGDLPGTALTVLFGGGADEWKALELAAALARACDASLRLAGADLGDRDASGLLARASLVVQRFAGVAAEPVLFAPGEERTLAGSGLLVAGGGARRDQLAASRARLGTLGMPLLLLLPGPRPGLLAPSQAVTRFSWSIA
jgi:hypothetical protein